MKYIIKQKNRIECISRNGDYHGFFTIKNVDIVLNAINTIKDHKITFVICGDGEKRASLEELAKQNIHKVVFCLYQS